MSIPIWVTDPTGNNNPFLKIVTARFVASEEALFTSPNVIATNARFWWSDDGLNWQLGTLDAGGALFGPSMDYANGMWMAKIFFNPQELGIFVVSYDGKTWSTVLTEQTNLGGGTFAFEYDNNRWNITYNTGNPISPTVTHLFIANPNPMETGTDPNDPRQADFLGPNPTTLEDKLQTGGTDNAINSLPSGFTGVRYNFASAPDTNPNTQTPPDTFQYTMTAITTTIVATPGWPGATWTQAFAFASVGDGNGHQTANLITYAPPGTSP